MFVRRGDEVSVTGTASPMAITVCKQRHGTAWRGEIGGFFNRTLRQYVVDQFQVGPTRYLDAHAYAPIEGEYDSLFPT